MKKLHEPNLVHTQLLCEHILKIVQPHIEKYVI